MKTLIIILLTPLVIWTLTRGILVPLFSGRSAATGIQPDGNLGSCPDKPNCVCSSDTDSHAITPLRFADASISEWQALLDAMGSLPGWKQINKDGHYAHFESRTPLMNYVDDVELLWQNEAGLIQVRSASRLGHSDLGANAKRVEVLRVLAHNTLKNS